MEFNHSYPLNAYTGSYESFGHSGSFYPEQGMNRDFQQPMWPSGVPSTPPNSPALYFSNAVALPFMYDNYHAPMPMPQPAFAANFQTDTKPWPFNASQYPHCNGCIGAESRPINGWQYSTVPVYSSGMLAQNYGIQLQSNASPIAVQSYTDYSTTTENSPYGFRQATFHPNYYQDSTSATMPLRFAQPYIYNATTDYPEAVRATPDNNSNIRWVNLDSTAAKTGFKTPARNATKASEKKAPTKPSAGVKKPRHKVTYKDRELLFRSCVTKLYDRCFWQGCEHIVFTDRKSITEHMHHVHGLDITLDFRVGCRWKDCKRNLKTESLFRHITNSHMHVVEAHCLYGCGEVFSRVDGRSRHMLTCPMRPSCEN